MWKRLTLVLALVFAPACSNSTPDGGSTAADAPITTSETWEAIRGGAVLVDVRTQDEFDQGHLDGALLIPYDEIARRASELGDSRERTIVLYCRTGNRSGKAKGTLDELGYTHVINAGGYEALKRAE